MPAPGLIVQHSSEGTAINVVRRYATTLYEGGGVPKLVITHDVADVDSWLNFKSERDHVIGGMGGTNVVDHVAHDGSTKVAVSSETDDVDATLAAIAWPSQDLLAAIERHGVIAPLTAYVEK